MNYNISSKDNILFFFPFLPILFISPFRALIRPPLVPQFPFDIQSLRCFRFMIPGKKDGVHLIYFYTAHYYHGKVYRAFILTTLLFQTSLQEHPPSALIIYPFLGLQVAPFVLLV